MATNYREALNVLDIKYPRLANLYDRMMRTARIVAPPTIEVDHYPFGCWANVSDDIIGLDRTYLRKGPVKEVQATIGHEVGHILNRDTGWGNKVKEQAADRLAVHLTQSHDDVSAMRQTWEREILDEHRFSRKLRLSFLPEKLATRIDALWPANPEDIELSFRVPNALYGTPEQLQANIRSVDLSDRSHLDRLVSEYNQRKTGHML